jgi:hypothetical protein
MKDRKDKCRVEHIATGRDDGHGVGFLIRSCRCLDMDV